ncbi:putative X8 domain-containing protein [Helianthus anomalus]
MEIILYRAVTTVVLVVLYSRIAAATWCVVRSEASREALQAALDYACGAGADCAPIQPSGLCFLPNTIQAHASYAFNSYYMRRSMAPGSCDFAGTATIAKTDPSYGSCNYPASPRFVAFVLRWFPYFI